MSSSFTFPTQHSKHYLFEGTNQNGQFDCDFCEMALAEQYCEVCTVSQVKRGVKGSSDEKWEKKETDPYFHPGEISEDNDRTGLHPRFCKTCFKIFHVLDSQHKPLPVKGLRDEAEEAVTAGYFQPVAEFKQDKPKRLLGVVVPAYNEEAFELKRTLHSLYEQQKMLKKKFEQGELYYDYTLSILVVLDGWWKTSESMKPYIKSLFPPTSDDPWPDRIKEVPKGKEDENVETFTLQMVHPNGRELVPVDIHNDVNDEERRKINDNYKQEYKKRDGILPYVAFLYNWFVTFFMIFSLVSAVFWFCRDYITEDITSFTDWRALFGGTIFALPFLLLLPLILPVKGRQDRKPWSGRVEKLIVSVMIKRDNRRKANSHAFFFGPFCETYNPTFAFCTDCGSFFDPKCLYHLVRHMERNIDCIACTGKQRVMSRESQTAGNPEATTETVMDKIFRGAQCFDYEASLASFMGAFSMAGFLPVLPGPCGMFRYAEMKEAIAYYLKLTKANPDESGIIQGSLLLAEDRILSYAVVLKNSRPSVTQWVPRAIFYFEAETESRILFQQRRRWVDGTVAGYLWLLSAKQGDEGEEKTKSLLFGYKHMSLPRRAMFTVLIFFQLIQYAFAALSPGIFTTGVYYALAVIHGGQYFSYVWTGFYFLVYATFAYVHSHKTEGVVFHYSLFAVTFLTGAVGIYGVIFATAYYITADGLSFEVYGIAVSLFAPFLLAFIIHPESWGLMVENFLHFITFLPSLVVYINTYAFSRTWELTWGNRPSDSLLSIKKTKTAEELQKIKADMYHRALGLSYLLIALNAAFVVLVIQLGASIDLFVMILSFGIFAPAGIQMGLSLLWIVLVHWPRSFCAGSRACLRDPCRRMRPIRKQHSLAAIETAP